MIAQTEAPVSFAPAIPVAPVKTDRRTHRRRDIARDLWLTDMRGQTRVNCHCRNISAGGMYADAPVGYGLAVGQRYELCFGGDQERPRSLLMGNSLGYATVIRTQVRPAGDDDAVGLALRFDAPKYLPI